LIFFKLVFFSAPVITTETTDSIEDLIKQRIRDKVFDDVERKKKTQNADEAQTYKKEILLEHEKSKMSLAQVYEQEYMKKQTVIHPSQSNLHSPSFF
jgi:U3 small nucleolar RNA-associated protein MPP10